MSKWTLFLYTGQDLKNFRSSVPDNIVVFISGSYNKARKSFIENIGKEPELMGFQYTEGSSKENAWQKAIDANLMVDDIEFNMVMALDGTLVIGTDTEGEEGDEREMN